MASIQTLTSGCSAGVRQDEVSDSCSRGDWVWRGSLRGHHWEYLGTIRSETKIWDFRFPALVFLVDIFGCKHLPISFSLPLNQPTTPRNLLLSMRSQKQMLKYWHSHMGGEKIKFRKISMLKYSSSANRQVLRSSSKIKTRDLQYVDKVVFPG